MPGISELGDEAPPVAVKAVVPHYPPEPPSEEAQVTPKPAKPPKGEKAALTLEDLEGARDRILHRMIEKIPKATGAELNSMLKAVEERINERKAKGAKTAGEETGTGAAFSRKKALEMLQGRELK